jgi:RNA polymerase sigma-70 factor (ECF subfamily)
MSLQPKESDLARAARQGDAAAFERLFGAHVPRLRGMLRRLVGHPDDAEDLVQQTLLKAWQAVEGYRGDASPSTWLCAIGSNVALDHLRQRKRWRERAQVIYAASCLEDPAIGAQVGAALNDPAFRFDVNEHVGYCFTCIGRSLAPEAQVALVLRDVLEFSNEEAAAAMTLSLAQFRHHLAVARQSMQATYDGLCALVNKKGICWQCNGLRMASPEGRKGHAIPEHLPWAERLHAVRETLLSTAGKPLHDVFFRHTAEQEAEGRGDPDSLTLCGVPDEPGGKAN